MTLAHCDRQRTMLTLDNDDRICSTPHVNLKSAGADLVLFSEMFCAGTRSPVNTIQTQEGDTTMRIAQVIVFMFGVFCFLSAAFFTGQETGDTLWRIGVAAMLIDLAWTKLWPSAKTS